MELFNCPNCGVEGLTIYEIKNGHCIFCNDIYEDGDEDGDEEL